MTAHTDSAGDSHGTVDANGNCGSCGADNLNPATGTYGGKA